MPNGGRFPLGIFVTGESTPETACWERVLAALSDLVFEKSRLQKDVFSGYKRTSKLFQSLFSVMEAERFVWAAIVQLFAFV